jgi:ABC-type transporter lipoprotein component MlaA
MFALFSRLALDIDINTDYATPYEENRTAYLKDAEALKKATGPYKAARDAYVAATATFTKSLYE